MGLFLISIALIGSLMIITPVQSQSCTVKDKATRRVTQCEFPFQFHGESYFGCIDFVDVKNGRKIYPKKRNTPNWCSTKVAGPDREHVGGGRHYGDCDSTCQSAEEAQAAIDQAKQNQNRPPPQSQAGGKDSGLWKPDGEEGECGKRNRISNIVGGRKAKIGDFPWMAIIGYNPPAIDGDEIFYVCGGSLINKHYVLTAAHCIDTENGFPVEVVLGEHKVGEDPDCGRNGDCNPPVIRREINKNKDIFVHENYDKKKNFANDIALIRMDKAVPLFQEDPSISAANPICLPWSQDNFAHFLEEGQRATVAGWGRTRGRANANAASALRRNKVNIKHLQQVEVPIANDKCKPKPPGERRGIVIDESRQICAGGERGKDSCNGDSGGPLFRREFTDDPWYQIGLVSFGTGVCAKGVPGVYTKVTNYLPWIESQLRP